MYLPHATRSYLLTLSVTLFLLNPLGHATRGAVKSVEEVVPDLMPGDLELAVIPKPKVEKSGDMMIAAGRAAVHMPQWHEFRAGREQMKDLLGAGTEIFTDKPDSLGEDVNALILIGTPADLDSYKDQLSGELALYAELLEKPNHDQGYVLTVKRGAAAGRHRVVILAAELRGAFYGLQTLKQLCFSDGDALYIRETQICDWPTFTGRGGKHIHDPWLFAFKANYQYSHGGKPWSREHFCQYWLSGIFPYKDKVLDATPEGLERMLKNMRNALERGATDVVLHVDDQPMALAPAAEARFGDDYFAAFAYLIAEIHRELASLRPQATLYVMPQTYWSQTQYAEFARRLWSDGRTPPAKFAISFNGPQVTTTVYSPDDVKAFSQAFGATQPAFLEDWHGRYTCFGAVEPINPALADVAICVSPGSGSATYRATRLDRDWNPENYDPERSLWLACREFAGIQNAGQLHEMLSTLEAAAPGPHYEPRAKVIRHLVESLGKAREKTEAMLALPDRGMQGRITLPKKMPTGRPADLIDQFIAASNMYDNARTEKLKEYAFKEVIATPVKVAPTIDGSPYESSWAGAATAGQFSAGGEAVAADNQTEFRCVYDAENLYIALRMNTDQPLDLNADVDQFKYASAPPLDKEQTEHDLPGVFHLHGWDSLSIMLDPGHSHLEAYEFQLDALGRRFDARHDLVGDDSRPDGSVWDGNWTSAVQRDDTGWTAELQIPWSDLGITPQEGHVLGLQIWRTRQKVRDNLWSMTPRWWGTISPSQAGHLILGAENQ